MRYLKLVFVLLAAGLALSPCARAQIGYLDGPSVIHYNAATTLNTSTFSVSSGANVLVICIGYRNSSSSQADPGNPTGVQWNGNPLTLAAGTNDGYGTWFHNNVYYLVNPPAGTGSVAATLASTVAQTWWKAYTLTNVNTAVAPLTGGNGSQGANVNGLTNTVAGVSYGSFAAINGACSANTATPFTDLNGGTVLTTTDNEGSAGMTMGGINALPAGNNSFIVTSATAGKISMSEAIFTPVAPGTPTWVSVTTNGTSANVNLSWTLAGAANFILERSTNSTGAYTDFTNILLGTTTSYLDTRVLGGTKYYYVVMAANGIGTNSSVQTNATPVGGPISPLLGAGASGPLSVTLKWLAPAFGATNYIVNRATSKGGETQIATTTNMTYVDSHLANGATYYYMVQAAGPGGKSVPSNEASAVAMANNFYLFDNFSLDTTNTGLNYAVGSAGLGQGWTNIGGGNPMTITNDGVTFGGANFVQYNSGAAQNIGDYEGGLAIASNSVAATVFLQFSLPGIQTTSGDIAVSNGAPPCVAMNFDIDNSSPPAYLTYAYTNGPSAQFNYDNFNGGGLFRMNGGNGNWYYAAISPTAAPYAPIPGNEYFFWFIFNAAKNTFQVYLADATMTGTNVDSGGLGTAPTLMWGQNTAGGEAPRYTYGFRNVYAGLTLQPPVNVGGQAVNYIGTGPGENLGSVAQNEFANIYVDRTAANLTNPVTGAAPMGAPIIFVQPLPAEVFTNDTAAFLCVGSAGVAYQWYENGTAMTDGGNISGSTTTTLTISNVTSANAANYNCIIENPAGAYLASLSVPLAIVPPGGAFERALTNSVPIHYYAFDDTGSPATGTEVAFDYIGCDDGIYGANVLNGYNAIFGPTPATGWPGFSANNLAASFSWYDEPNGVTLNSPWNLDTNTVTLSAWIYPTASQSSGTAIVFCRGAGSDVEGLNFTCNGDSDLGYTWNNDANTTNWDSGLQPPLNQWSFVSLVVTPTNATIYLMNSNGVVPSTFVYPHVVAPFAGTTMIGDDPGYVAGGTSTFNGSIDSVAVYGQALSETALLQLFTNASGITSYRTFNTVGPASTNLYPRQTAQFSAVLVGGAPPANTCAWQLNGANLTDGANSLGTIIGSSTTTLTISNLTGAIEGQTNYFALVTGNGNPGGAYTSSVPAELIGLTPTPGIIITNTEQEPLYADWNTGASWSDGNPAWFSAAYSAPGSTYVIQPGDVERTPITNSIFPGVELVVQGDGNLIDAYSAAFPSETTIGELRFKAAATTTVTNFGTVYNSGASVTFTNLQLAGGQVDNAEVSWITVNGQIDVLSNSVFYTESGEPGNEPIQINALVTGAGTLTYAFLAPQYASNDLILTCASNTFSGQWNVLQGTLLGTAPNCLGTNSITVAALGSLETTYALYSPAAGLTLNGQMNLYQNDTFNNVTINGTAISPGTYTFAQLNKFYPTNFPVTWTVQAGSSTGTNTGVGSLTVLTGPPPPLPPTIGYISLAGQTLTLSGFGGTASGAYYVLTTTNLLMPMSAWSVVTNGAFDSSGNFTMSIPVSAGAAQLFYSLVSP